MNSFERYYPKQVVLVMSCVQPALSRGPMTENRVTRRLYSLRGLVRGEAARTQPHPTRNYDARTAFWLPPALHRDQSAQGSESGHG